MADPFMMKVKPDKTGKIWPCKICDKTPNEGDELWMQNIGTPEDKKWIASPHEECFKKLQENPELAAKKKQSNYNSRGFTPSKFPISEAVNLYELSDQLLACFVKKHDDSSQSKFTIEQKAIFIESMFRTLSGNFKP